MFTIAGRTVGTKGRFQTFVHVFRVDAMQGKVR